MEEIDLFIPLELLSTCPLLWELPYKNANSGRCILKELFVANSNALLLELKLPGHS